MGTELAQSRISDGTGALRLTTDMSEGGVRRAGKGTD
jgi:hypothetical protein